MGSSQTKNLNNEDFIEALQSIEDIVFGLSENNIESSVDSTLNLYYKQFPYSFNLVICRLVYSYFTSQLQNVKICFDYLKSLQIKEEKLNVYNVIDIFKELLLYFDRQESYYLLEKMIEHKLIDQESITNIKSLYFCHYKSKEEIYNLRNNNYPFETQFFANFYELSNSDWELHKQLIKEGINPNEISKIIRNDEIEKLHEISSQNYFDFNQKIEQSLYERYSFINGEDVTLIDYAAFFSAVKCFKYLLLNGSLILHTGKYAIAGGNAEIIHLCEQNHSTFEDAYETAIEFHRNDIFKYIYENKIGKINSLEELGKKCVLYDNYEIFMFLEENGMKIDKFCFKKSIEIGNIFLVKYFSQKYNVPKNILNSVIISRNEELFKYSLMKKWIDLKTKCVDFF